MSYVLLHNNYPNGSGLKQYFLTVSVGQESRYNFSVSSVPRFLTATVKVLGRDQSHLKAHLGADLLPSSLTWLIAGFSSFQATGLKASVSSW